MATGVSILNKKVNVPKYLHELHGESPTMFSLLMTYFTGLIVGLLVIVFISSSGMPIWKKLILFILYLDIAGGVVANFSSSTKRYYEKHVELRYYFIFLHFLHPLLFILLFPDSVYYFIYVGLFTIIACLFLYQVKNVEVQQTFASFLLVAGVLISFFFNLPLKVLYSFAPLFMTKLIIGFSVKRQDHEYQD